MFQRGYGVRALCMLAFIGSVPVARSQTVTWGGGFPDNNLTTDSNWQSGFAPLNDGSEDLVFPSNSSGFLVLDVTGRFNSLTTEGANDSGATLSGAPLQIGAGGIFVNSGSGSSFLIINSDIALQAPQAWGVGAEGGSLTVNGVITGAQPIAFTGDGFEVQLNLANPNSTFGDPTHGLTVTGSTTSLVVGSSSVGGVPGAPASGPVGVGPLTLGFGTNLETSGSAAVTLANNLVLGDNPTSGTVTFGIESESQQIAPTQFTLTGAVSLTGASTTLDFGENTQVTFTGAITAQQPETDLILTQGSDQASQVILRGPISNISTLSATSSLSVILDGTYATQISGLQALNTSSSGYLGLGTGYIGNVNNFISFVGAGNINGTLGFDSTGAVGTFTEDIDLTNFDTETFVGLGSATNAILSGSITPPGGFLNSTSYPFGGGGGTLTVTSSLVDGFSDGPISNSLSLEPGNAPLTLVLSGAGVAAYTGNTSVDGAALIFDTALPAPTGGNKIQIGEFFDEFGYVGTTTASGVLDNTPNPLVPLLNIVDPGSLGVVGFDDLTGGTRDITGTIDLSNFPGLFLGTATKVIYEGTIIPAAETNTFQFSGVKGGQVTVNSSSLVGSNSVVIGLPIPIESHGSVSSVSLPGNNYYSGGTTLNSGYLYVGTSNSLGSGNLTVEEGGTVGLAPTEGNNVLLDTPISLQSAILHLNTATSGQILTLGGPIDGDGFLSSLMIDGPVELDGLNTEIETITVNNGTTLTLGNDQSSGQATVMGTSGTTINFTSASPQIDALMLTGSTANFADGSTPFFFDVSLAEGSHLNFGANSFPEIDQFSSDGPGSGNSISIGSNSVLSFNLEEDPDFYGTITGTGGIEIESGTLNLAGANTFSGGATVDFGATLIASNAAALGTNSVQVIGTLAVNKATTVTNPIVLSDGGTLAGFGTFSPGGTLVFQNGSTLVPGIVNLNTNDSNGTIPAIGTLGFGGGTSVTFAPGGHFTFGVADATGAAGVGYSTANVTGSLNITASFGNEFIIDIYSLAPGSSQTFLNAPANFDATQGYSWTFVTAGSISSFDPTSFILNSAGFVNPSGTGGFYLTQSGNNLMLNFSPVPEPSTWVLMIAGLAGVGVGLRRRKPVAS